jgi:hypothetical protein
MRRLIIATSFACLNACSIEYTAAPTSAHVVDAETGEPLSGVHVVADWQLEGGLEGGSRVGALMIMETQTDANGRFTFLAWGPRNPVSVAAHSAGTPRLKTSAPQLLLFKSGYEYVELRNSISGPLPPDVRSEWDGKRIELKPFRGDAAQYERQISGLSDVLMHDTANASVCRRAGPCPSSCQWERVPLMLRALQRQYQQFKDAGIRASNVVDHLIHNDSAFQRLGCASPEALLKGTVE